MAQEFYVSPSTASRFWKWYGEIGHYSSRSDKSCKYKTTPRVTDFFVLRHQISTPRNLLNVLYMASRIISDHTIRNRLRVYGIRSKRSVRKSHLSNQHKRA